MTIKAAWIVTDMSIHPNTKATGLYSSEVKEFKTERAAIAAAKKSLTDGRCEDEVWVWKLSHVVSRPETEPDVEAVK